MKHIFTVHSPLTFLIAYSVIQKEKLSENDVIIISSGYKPPFELDYVKSAFQDLHSSFFSRVKSWNTPLAYDRYIETLTKGQDFIAYIDLMAMYQRILVTNPKCKQFHFIEEGSASYVQPSNLDNISHFFRKKFPYRYDGYRNILKGIKFIVRGYSIRLLGMPYWPESYGNFCNIKFYCFSKDAFPGVEREKLEIIELTDKPAIVPEMAKNLSLTKEYIWIEDNMANTYRMPESSYREAIIETIKYLKENIEVKEIHLKLRPELKLKDSVVNESLINAGFKVEVIDNGIVIEALLANSQDCIVIGNVSSVLFYAPLFGHQSLSMFNLMKNKPKTAFDDFDVFWKNIERI